MTPDSCPYCRQRLGGDVIQLWGNRVYHRYCVERAAPEMLTELPAQGPSDIVKAEQVRWRNFLAYLAPRVLLFVSGFFGIPMLLVGLLRGEWFGLLFVMIFFGGGTICLLSLQGAIGVFAHRRRLPRTVQIDATSVLLHRPKKSISVPLADCRWYIGSPMHDQLCMFTKLRNAVMLVMPDERIACGFEPRAFEQFRAFLTLEQVRRIERIPYVRIALSAAAAAAAMGAAGYLVGLVLRQQTGVAFWVVAMTILGALDGGIASIMYLTCTYDAAKAATKRMNPFLLGLMFFVLGAKIIGMFPDAFAVGGVNAIGGSVLGVLCRRRISQAEKQAELNAMYQGG